MPEESLVGQGAIARRLDYLIRELHPAGRGPYSYVELADLIRQRASLDNGPTVSHGTIQNIRSGRVTNPGVESLQAIARFFGVTTAYFTDDAVAEVTISRIREIRESGERAKASDELADALEDQQVRAVAFRLGGLSSNALRGIKGIVEGFREAEGLPAVTSDPEPGPAARTS
ncbi:helix-turn-helix domain-containing protein [Streptomyces sp. NBC_00648]|uniref:helix-turn-helix domain-containing protein n=1 Tax=Streptomyces sp. NBC_00648 TaxID=2975797 RepID=UPI0032527860